MCMGHGSDIQMDWNPGLIWASAVTFDYPPFCPTYPHVLFPLAGLLQLYQTLPTRRFSVQIATHVPFSLSTLLACSLQGADTRQGHLVALVASLRQQVAALEGAMRAAQVRTGGRKGEGQRGKGHKSVEEGQGGRA